MATVKKEHILNDEKLWDFHQLENRGSFNLAAPRIRFLVKQILGSKKSCKILDIGFGDGQLLRLLSHHHFNLCGTDISEKNVNKTRSEFAENKINADLRVAEITDIPFGDGEFDVVVATEVLEHAGEQELQKGLQEIKRVLKDGGVFLGTVPANEGLSDSTCFCPKCGNVFHRWGHKQSFTGSKIENILGDTFESVDIRLKTFFWQNKPESSFLKLIKFYVKMGTFYLTQRILGATYWFYFRAKK